MATDRQLAANRNNARKSTGPRSALGKIRASNNSYRHGFSAKRRPFDRDAIDDLACELAGLDPDLISLELAREAAEAQLTVRLLSQTKISLINRIIMFGELQVQEPAVPRMPPKALWNFLEICRLTETFPRPPDATKTMPTGASDRAAESIRRALPELLMLERYERRAASRRDAAVRRLLTRRRAFNKEGVEMQNEANLPFEINARSNAPLSS